MEWDSELKAEILNLKEALSLDEAHLTGGEPTASPHIIEIISGLKSIGLSVKGTTIGCNLSLLPQMASAGLDALNFSLHSIEAEELLTTQVNRNLAWSQKQLAQQMQALLKARELGIAVKANTVITTEEDIPRITRVIEWCEQNEIQLRIMNEISTGRASAIAGEVLFRELGAVETRQELIRGSSSMRSYYRLPSGYEIGFKYIRENYLQTMCSTCPLRELSCNEKFYGVRLERRAIAADKKQLMIRLCLHKSDNTTYMPIRAFLDSDQLRDIKHQIANIEDDTFQANIRETFEQNLDPELNS